MIGYQVTSGKNGEPIDSGGQKLSESSYQPQGKVADLYMRAQLDYNLAWRLQHRPFDDFDGVSLLERTRMDQQTFAAYVGAEFVPQHKKWRWRGRKHTARNKMLGILAHMLSGMLYPYVYAFNEENEEDKLTAAVMRILIEDHLKHADYEMKFLYMVTSALVNPAVFVEVQYVVAFQRIKQKLKDGKIKVVEAIDELLSGIALNIVPVDQILLADFYTNDLQSQPYIVRVRRIPWDEARKIYAKKYYEKSTGTDLFDYVMAGKTRVVLAGQEKQTLYNIDWTEADRDYVQEITWYYRLEDLQFTVVGGVMMVNEDDVYNNNPFEHRRMSLIGDEWLSIPVYPLAKSGFEPLDPTGRFAYYKSAAFKEYWDDRALNVMQQLAFDGTYLDVIKPHFLSGIAKVDSMVIAPGATIGMPMGAQVTPYSIGPNLQMAYQNIMRQEQDLSESTQDKVMTGVTEQKVTATQTAVAERNARINMGNFGLMIASLIEQVGELVVDCIIQHTTIGELDATVPEALAMKYKSMIVRTKESGKDLTNQIRFTSKDMGKKMSQEDIKKRVFELSDEAGGLDTDQRIYEVNPYKFARTKFNVSIDADQIVMKSMGMDKQRKQLAFNMLTDPRVAPFTDQKAVVDKLVIEEFSEGDPEEFKRKDNQPDMLNQIMGNQMGQGQQGGGGVGLPQQQQIQPAMA